jgi:PhnO protein
MQTTYYKSKIMKSQVGIRKVKQQDLDFVYKSICELENEELDFELFAAIFYENIASPNNLYLIAENEIEGLGFISFHTLNLLHHCGRVGEIQEFFINENHRGKGIGRQLVEKIMEYAEEHKLKSIEVTTNKRRVENVMIYENLGFTLSHNKFTIYK